MYHCTFQIVSNDFCENLRLTYLNHTSMILLNYKNDYSRGDVEDFADFSFLCGTILLP